MRLVAIGISSVNTTVGAVAKNTDTAIAHARQMAAAGVTLGVFPEQTIGGYPAEDLVQWRTFVTAQRAALERFARETAPLGATFAIGLTVEHEAHRYNAAAVVARGKILGIVPKEKLPTYNVFYEQRTYTEGRPWLEATIWDTVPFGDLLFRFDWGVLAVEVCEDAWSPDGPMRRRAYSGAELVANLSASPYRLGVADTRREMLATRSGDNAIALAYANQVGGQDGLIFDGGGFVCQNGRLVHTHARFQEGWSQVTIDLDRTSRLRAESTTWRDDAVLAGDRRVKMITAPDPGADRGALKYPVPAGRSFFLPPIEATPPPSPRAAFCDEVMAALALGLADYTTKNGFKCIAVALSGGRDSLLALHLAARACARLGVSPANFVRAFYMPTRFSSEGTRKAASRSAADLGVPFQIISIDDAFQRELEAAKAMLRPGEDVHPLAQQNIQARIRGARMWNLANSTGALFLQTGNMSEKAVGYTTIGGDLEGGLSVISNLPKTVVIALLDHLLATEKHEGIRLALEVPAGPELAADQEGEKELMPFPILDACFALHAGEKLAPDEMKIALPAIFPEVSAVTLATYVDRFYKMFSRSIYKWVQAPLGLHVGNLDLDRERALQIPVVTSDEWTK